MTDTMIATRDPSARPAAPFSAGAADQGRSSFQGVQPDQMALRHLSPRLPPRHLRMAGDAGSLRDARHLVAQALDTAPPAIRDSAMLLVGEVVTNAVVHGGGWFLLQVDSLPECIRVEVTDATAGQPRVLQMNGEREHGRGMAIVDALADQWGTRHMGSHKVVWFELALNPEQT
jgi:anti-sigma regulatory factor (Ser/Thr protein kinase)